MWEMAEKAGMCVCSAWPILLMAFSLGLVRTGPELGPGEKASSSKKNRTLSPEVRK